jgi:ferric-dicitrate binding protein FerR (iron transport regulator)
MDNRNNIKELLHKYFRNECSKTEIHRIYEWLDDPVHQPEFNKVLDQYLKDEKADIPHHITRLNSWQNISNKIAQEKQHEPVEKHQSNWWHLGKAAAVFLIITLGSLLYINRNQLFTEPTAPQETFSAVFKQTEKGQKRNIKLPDGSQVILNSASSLTIASDYSQGNTRTVYLKGEAFFEVEKNPEQPFLVIVDQVTTRVLGTSFNVDAYNTNEVKVAVQTGKVQVSSEDLSLDLIPNEMAVYKQHEGILKSRFDHLLTFGWKDGYLVFEKADFQTLVNKLELWYGVNITLKGEKPEDTFTASYHRESLETVLEGISFSGDFEYQLEDKNLIIEFK